MAFFLRRSVSSVFARVVGCRRSLYNTAFTSPTGGITPAAPAASLLTRRNYSDKKLLEAVDSEIQLTLKPYEHYKSVEVPGHFPFEISKEEVDYFEIHKHYKAFPISEQFPYKIWQQPCISHAHILCFEREYKGDRVVIEVVPHEDDKDPRLQLAVTVDVVDDTADEIELEFRCIAFPRKFTIIKFDMESVRFAPPPPLWSLHKDLHQGLYEYLDTRGINLSTSNFLRKFIADNQQYLSWLKRKYFMPHNQESLSRPYKWPPLIEYCLENWE